MAEVGLYFDGISVASTGAELRARGPTPSASIERHSIGDDHRGDGRRRRVARRGCDPAIRQAEADRTAPIILPR